MNYEKRVVCFIDILGFKGIIDGTVTDEGSDNTEEIDYLIKIFYGIRGIWHLDDYDANSSRPDSNKITIFSDSIVASIPLTEEVTIYEAITQLKFLILRLIYAGVLCRGSVTVGKFLHTDAFLFGPALVDAYILESKKAVYPRVVIDQSVISAIGQTKLQKPYFEALIEKDDDGMYYIEYFLKAREFLDNPVCHFPQYIEIMRNIISSGLEIADQSSSNNIREKYEWMRTRYNNMVTTVKQPGWLEAHQKKGFEAPEEWYDNLELI